MDLLTEVTGITGCPGTQAESHQPVPPPPFTGSAPWIHTGTGMFVKLKKVDTVILVSSIGIIFTRSSDKKTGLSNFTCSTT
jgi:hypothetical protein